MNTNRLCEDVRMTLMASFDGETGAPSTDHEQHLLSCSSCRDWLDHAQSLAGQLQSLSYPDAQRDLWPAVEERIGQPKQSAFPRGLWIIAAVVVVWRALQLLVDLPMPLLHPLVPLVALVLAVWLLAQDPFAIETSAPELEKRGI